MLSKKTIIRSWVFVFIWMGVIFTLSSIPGDNLPEIPIPNINLLAHMIEYSILGVLIIRALQNSHLKLSFAGLIILALILTALFAISDELHQYFVPNRLADVGDFLTDIFSASVGIFLYTAKIASFKRSS